MLRAAHLPVTAALVLVSGLAVAGCGPAAKQAAVRRVTSAAEQPGVRTGTVSLSIEPGSGAPAGGTTGLRAPTRPVEARVVLDAAHNEAALLAPAALSSKLGGQVLTLFTRSVVYSRTADVGVVGARPWFRLDTAHLGALNHYSAQDLAQPATLGDLVVVDPLTVVTQLHGLLTGSVKVHKGEVSAPDSTSPVPAVEYDGNTSFAKVARQLHVDPDSEKPVRNLLGVFAAKQDINPISIWLSPTGALLRVQVTYICKPAKRIEFKVIYNLVLNPPQAAPPAPDALLAPNRNDVVDVASLNQLSLALQTLGQAGGDA